VTDLKRHESVKEIIEIERYLENDGKKNDQTPELWLC
jgi:hypothetical protein